MFDNWKVFVYKIESIISPAHELTKHELLDTNFLRGIFRGGVWVLEHPHKTQSILS